MFCLFFMWYNLLLLISALCFSHNAPHQPTELAQTALHPATDYLCGRWRLRCTRAGEATDVCSWSKIPTLTCGYIIQYYSSEETSSPANGALQDVSFSFLFFLVIPLSFSHQRMFCFTTVPLDCAHIMSDESWAISIHTAGHLSGCWQHQLARSWCQGYWQVRGRASHNNDTFLLSCTKG